MCEELVGAEKTCFDSVNDLQQLASAHAGLALWRTRDWLLLWSGQVVSSTGTRVTLLAFSLLTLAVTGSPTEAGLVGALRGVSAALIALPAGALVDQWDRRRIMLACDLGRVIVVGSVGLALLADSLTLLHLAMAALFEGALSTFFSLSESACLPHVVPTGQLAPAAAADQASTAAAELVGPAIGGALYEFGAGIPFLVDAATYLASFGSLLLMRTPFQDVHPSIANSPTQSLYEQVCDGLAWVRREPLIRFLALLHGGVNLCGFGYTLILIVAAQQQGATQFEIGLILASGGAAALIASTVVGKLGHRVDHERLLIPSMWILALTWLTYILAPTPQWLGLANALACGAIPIYMAALLSFRLTQTPDGFQGRVSSVFRLVNFGLQPLSLVLTGALLDRIGMISTVVLLSVPQVLLALAATLHPGLRPGWNAKLGGRVIKRCAGGAISTGEA